MEALVLSLIGGVIGILIGVGGTYAINTFSSFTAALTVSYVVIPFAFSGLVGLFFGYFPAYKASKLSPINALRYE
jgi:putative ABC transport system permease protein